MALRALLETDLAALRAGDVGYNPNVRCSPSGNEAELDVMSRDDLPLEAGAVRRRQHAAMRSSTVR